MHLVKISPVVMALFLGLVGVSASATDVRSAKGGSVPPATEVPQNNIQVAPMMGGAMQGQITLTVTGTAQGVAKGVSVDANGVKHFQNEEYGRKIKITDDPQNGIKIECIRKKGGTDETKNYEAKDAAELEKKHPEGFKLYQKYLGQQAGAGAVILQGQAARIQMAPGQPVPLPMPGGAGVPQVIQGQAVLVGPGGSFPIEVATERMGQLSKDIKSATNSGAWKDASKETKAALKKQADGLKKQLLDLENQLGEK